MKKESYDIILRPLLTEKGMNLQENVNKYLFEVRKDANKIDVRRAVEKIFKVNVTKVNIIVVPGKWKRVGKFEGRGTGWKKAVVTLKAGDKIEFYEGV